MNKYCPQSPIRDYGRPMPKALLSAAMHIEFQGSENETTEVNSYSIALVNIISSGDLLAESQNNGFSSEVTIAMDWFFVVAIALIFVSIGLL